MTEDNSTDCTCVPLGHPVQNEVEQDIPATPSLHPFSLKCMNCLEKEILYIKRKVNKGYN